MIATEYFFVFTTKLGDKGKSPARSSDHYVHLCDELIERKSATVYRVSSLQYD